MAMKQHQGHASSKFLACLLACALAGNTLPLYAAAEGKGNQPSVNSDAQKSAAIASHENRPGGLVGFEGDYELGDSDEMVSVIVEFANQPASLVQAIAKANGKRAAGFNALQSKAKEDKQDFYKALEGIDYKVAYEYDTALNGVSLTLPEYFIDDIANLDCVFAVYPNEVYENVTPPDGITKDPYAVTTFANEGKKNSQGMEDSRAYLGIEELGLTGRGVTVGIIDTGIDYNHPDLKGAFASTLPDGTKPEASALIDGRFVGRNFINNGNGSNDPMDDHGHGTHVAGTVGARGVNDAGISAKGLAPEATLVSYKAINSKNSCYLNDIVAAMSAAVEDGCEIISMSLGWSSANDATHGTNLALNSLALQNEDVLFVVCAGNNGSDSYTLWSPGTSPLAMTVANASIPSTNRLLTMTLVPEAGKVAEGDEPADPENKPEDPENKPEDPENKPEDPENKPEDPENKPEDPENKPADPENKPEVPENKPENNEPVNPEKAPDDSEAGKIAAASVEAEPEEATEEEKVPAPEKEEAQEDQENKENKPEAPKKHKNKHKKEQQQENGEGSSKIAAKSGKIRLIRSDWMDQVEEDTKGGRFTIENALRDDADGNYRVVVLPTADGKAIGTGTQEEFDAFFADKDPVEYRGTLFVMMRGQNFDNIIPRMKGKVGNGAIVIINTEGRDMTNISWWQGYFNNYAPVFTVDYKEGTELVSELTAGEVYKFRFTDAEGLHSIAAGETGCYPSYDTSVGPVTKTFDLKPDIAAPGTAVISTVFKGYYDPENDSYDSAYAPMSGTSMATPHISAIAALLRQKAPNLTALELKSLMVNTANREAFSDKISRMAVGAGMVNPAAAVAAINDMVMMTAENDHAFSNLENVSTTVSTPTISMDYAQYGENTERTVTVHVTNNGSESHTYAVSLENQRFAAINGSTTASKESVFSVSKNNITVAAGSEATFELTANVPSTASKGSYETTVVLTEEDGTRLASPAAIFVYYAEPIYEEPVDGYNTFIHNAVLSSGDDMQLKDFRLHGSDRTILHFRFEDPEIDTWQPMLYTRDGKLVGQIDGWYRDSWAQWTWYYNDTIGSWYTPCTMDENNKITLTGERGAIPEGMYKLALLLTKADVPSKVVEVADLCIDNTLPTLTFSKNKGNKVIGKVDGENVVFSGSIYDKFTEEMQKLNINSTVDERIFGNKTSQKDNVVVLRIGEKDYRAAIDETGAFSITVPKAEAKGTATVYYGDHFLPQGNEGEIDTFHEGFVPDALSYAVQEFNGDAVPYMNNYAYRATNMASMEVELAVKEKPVDPEKPDPDKPEKPESNKPSHEEVEKGFWEKAEEKIEKAENGSTVKIYAGDHDNMPDSIMELLDEKNITLVIQWNGGNDIVIPAGKAADEKGRLYWPLNVLEEMYGKAYNKPTADKVNPSTGA